MKLKILVGTVTNTAEYVAQAIELDCADLVERIDVQLMDGLDVSVFDAVPGDDTLYLICTSTYGAGDPPDNAAGLYVSLGQNPKFLGHVRYGVIALGDSASHAPTFCGAGHLFDAQLTDLGAHRIGDMLCLDAASGQEPEAEGTRWARAWLAQALTAAA